MEFEREDEGAVQGEARRYGGEHGIERAEPVEEVRGEDKGKRALIVGKEGDRVGVMQLGVEAAGESGHGGGDFHADERAEREIRERDGGEAGAAAEIEHGTEMRARRRSGVGEDCGAEEAGHAGGAEARAEDLDRGAIGCREQAGGGCEMAERGIGGLELPGGGKGGGGGFGAAL